MYVNGSTNDVNGSDIYQVKSHFVDMTYTLNTISKVQRIVKNIQL